MMLLDDKQTRRKRQHRPDISKRVTPLVGRNYDIRYMKLNTRVLDTLAIAPHGVGSIAPVALSRKDVLLGVE